jgi:tetratricopeptide (TPR) repeat protein
MQITSRKSTTSQLPANEAASQACQKALELKDKGDYDGAQAAMRRFWKGFGERPNTTGLEPSLAAEVLLCVGILTGWIGSRDENGEADGTAKDLITESIIYFQSVGDVKKVAAAQSELAYCYWRTGALDEARVMFTEALQKLTAPGNTRANALLGLSVVEWSDCRFNEALKVLNENGALFKKITNHTLKGFYHNQLAMVLRKLTTPKDQRNNFRRIITEYQEADHQFKLARNTIFRAMVKNNIGNLLRELSRFKEAYEYLDQARRLTVSIRDRVRTAQVDQTRAHVMIAEGRYSEAARVARLASRSFERSGRQRLLLDALISRGIALSRLRRIEEAEFTFKRAIEVAQQVDVPKQAGLAALAMIEELDDLSIQTLAVAYERANEWLADSQSPNLLRRINTAASKLLARLQIEMITEEATDAIANKPLDFNQELLKYENALIKRALAQVNGSLTRAASLLSMSYQKLAYIIETRHRDLIKERSPVRRRSRKND